MPVDLDALEALLLRRDDSEQAWKMCLNGLLISAPALIAELRALRTYRDEVEANKPTVQALLNLGEVAASDRAWLRDCLLNEQAANRWRPIAEGLPEDNVNVLVWDGERVSKAFQRGGYWFGHDFYMELAHWRPLPDPPEGA